MKKIKLLFLVIISQTSFAQISKDSLLFIKGTPFVKGVIKIKHNTIEEKGDPSSFVPVLSYSDSVFNIKDGVVKEVLDKNGDITVIIERYKDDIYFVYDNFSNVLVKKGQRLKEGSYIGKAKVDEPNINMIAISIYQRTRPLSYNEVINFFKIKETIKSIN